MITIREKQVASTLNAKTVGRPELKHQNYNEARAVFKFLPAFVRYFDVESQLLLLERAPEVRLVRYEDKVYEIELPWMLYLVNLADPNEYHVFFNTSQLNSFDDIVYAPALPNTASDGHFCFALPADIEISKQFILNSPYLRERISYIIACVWDSPFNTYYFLDMDNVPTFVSDEQKAELFEGKNKTDQWHAWLSWWEDNIDLITALKWETTKPYTLSSFMPTPKELTENDSHDESEAAIMSFIETYAKSLV